MNIHVWEAWVGRICMGDDKLAVPCMGAVGVSLLCWVCGSRWFCCLLWLFVWGNLFNLGLFCCILCRGGSLGVWGFARVLLRVVVVAGQPLTQTIC